MAKNEKRRNRIHQEMDLNIVDWFLAIDFEVGQTTGATEA